MHMNSDIIIIGAGPGGYETALYAAKKGLSVTLFEERRVGGTCLQEGCIPTKCFCRSAEVADTIAHCEAMGIGATAPTVDMARVVARKNEVVAQLTAGIEFLLKNKLITCIPERAELLDAHAVKSASGETYTARHILIATGSTAKIPPIAGSDLPGVVTSTQLLDIDHIPSRLCIVGAGVIGLEFASIFRSFGSEVTMLEFAKEILPNFDTDISKRLKQVLSKRGIEFFNQAGVNSIESTGSGLTVRYTWKNQEHTVEADTVLIATGRAPRVEGLGLDTVGIHYSPKGIETDDNLQTNVPDVYAIGDSLGRIYPPRSRHGGTHRRGVQTAGHRLHGQEIDLPGQRYGGEHGRARRAVQTHCRRKRPHHRRPYLRGPRCRSDTGDFGPDEPRYHRSPTERDGTCTPHPLGGAARVCPGILGNPPTPQDNERGCIYLGCSLFPYKRT